MAKVLGMLVAALGAWGSAAQADEHGRWQALENNPSCSMWNALPPHQNVTITWSGACVNGKAQGRGTKVLRALIDGDWKTAKYEGEMKEGKEHGRGVLVYADSARYEGDWKDGKWHGHGVRVFANGDRYEGDWKDGKRTGRGVYEFANGDKCEGDWREDRLLGTGEGWQNGQLKKCYLDGDTIKFTD